MKKGIMWLCSAFVLVALTGCFGAKSTWMAGRGGEVVGVSGRGFTGRSLRHGEGEPWLPEDGLGKARLVFGVEKRL